MKMIKIELTEYDLEIINLSLCKEYNEIGENIKQFHHKSAPREAYIDCQRQVEEVIKKVNDGLEGRVKS